MARVKVTEEYLVKQIEQLDAKRKQLKKTLQVFRIRAAAAKRKSLFKSIRKNEKEVLELLKSKAPDFFDKLAGEQPKRKRRATRKAVKKGARKLAARKAA